MVTGKDPGLEDMLSEPMIVRLMLSDRIRAEDARALYAEVADRIRDRCDDRGAEAPIRDHRAAKGIIYA